MQAPRNMKCVYFNPLPPCGGRRFSITKDGEWIPFQSTPSVWRETRSRVKIILIRSISIHSLRVEGDSPTPDAQCSQTISIHSLRVEGDKKLFALDKCNLISIHSLRVEGDFAERISNDIKDISIHSLRVEGYLLPPLLFTS